jgi:hypothetical protein
MNRKLQNKNLNCPECGTQIDVDALMISQFRDSIRKDLRDEMYEREQELQSKQDEFNEMSKSFAKERADLEKQVQEQVNERMSTREAEIKLEIGRKIQEETAVQLQGLEDELIRKSKQLKNANKDKADLVRLQRELEEQEARIVLQKEQELTKRLDEAKEFIREQVAQENQLRLREKEKLISDLKSKLDEAKRKVEQGSMQMQGEIQELEIIDILQNSYPFDDIAQSKKGANGADILQQINTQYGVRIGSIYYESKRTQAYSDKWIPKLKNDNLSVKADILVLVTETLPKGITKWGIIDDVWICDMASVKELSLVLRYGLLKVYAVAQNQHQAKEKSELLYQYITSDEFKNLFENIVRGFKSIQESHHNEQLKIKRLWVEREKQLQQILSNLVEHYGSLRNIGGDSMVEIQMFEFIKQAG